MIKGGPPRFDGSSDELLEFPLFGARPCSGEPSGEMAWPLLQLDLDYLRDKWLPELVRNHLSLAAKEAELLRFLIHHREQVVTCASLLQRVWPEQPFLTPRTVDVHIAWLRQKLEGDPQTPKHILTVRGEGCRFVR